MRDNDIFFPSDSDNRHLHRDYSSFPIIPDNISADIINCHQLFDKTIIGNIYVVDDPKNIVIIRQGYTQQSSQGWQTHLGYRATCHETRYSRPQHISDLNRIHHLSFTVLIYLEDPLQISWMIFRPTQPVH